MSSWNTLEFSFKPLEPIKGPLQGVLSVLQVVEAILEALLEIIKIFLFDFGNPIKALVALILAAVRAIINQIKSAGFSILLVHPDFSRQDFSATLESVSGGYATFESKVVGKFFDTGDIFRPQYPSGSAVAMLALYIGAESPGDLLKQLSELLKLIRHPETLSSLPAPVELKARPLMKSDAGLAQVGALFKAATKFSDLFGDVDQKIVLEWRMPTTPTAAQGPSFTNALSSFYNSFRFPNFLIERSESPTGDAVNVKLDSPTAGNGDEKRQLKKFRFPSPGGTVQLRERNGDVVRFFPKKVAVAAESGLLEGQLTGTYRYVDEDVKPGKTYYYRVRAYFGNPATYIGAGSASDLANNRSLRRQEGNQFFIEYGSGVAMGSPSAVARGFCPRPRGGTSSFNAYEHVRQAVEAGILLNFEFPPATRDDEENRTDQKAGWGCLSVVGGQIGPLKSAFDSSDKLRPVVIFKWTARRVSNMVAASSYSKPDLTALIAQKWDGVADVVDRVLTAPFTWKFVGVVGGITSGSDEKVEDYLHAEDPSDESKYSLGTALEGTPLDGPYPSSSYVVNGRDYAVSAAERRLLADFLSLCIGSSGGAGSYLSWRSVTVGDLFPALIPVIFDFEQFLQSLMKALGSVIKEIEAIIEAIIQKIQQLENILKAVLNLIEILSITVSVSILGYTTGNGSAASLAEALISSENKPGSLPFGLHSGMVMTFGGPGEGATAAFKALGFVLGIG